jgi:hypothetical protein
VKAATTLLYAEQRPGEIQADEQQRHDGANDENKVGETGLGERQEMGYDGTGADKQQGHQHQVVLGLQDDEQDDGQAHARKEAVEQADAYLILKTAMPDVYDAHEKE